MSASAVRPAEVEGALGRALVDLLAEIRRGATGSAGGGETVAAVLAAHALVESVTGAAVCVIDRDEMVRVAGVAGATGGVSGGSLWRLAASPVGEVLAGSAPIRPVAPTHGPLVRALAVPGLGELLAIPLRLGAVGNAEPTSLGALLLVRDRTASLDRADCEFLLAHASLTAIALFALRDPRLDADAQAASAAMSSFLNLVVHDLRAPLTVLSGYVDLLRDGTFGAAPEEWRRPMELITAKLAETHRLVDDILLAARLESGGVPATIERLDLNEVITRAATRSEARAGLAGAVIVTAPHPRPVTAYGDVFHVDRVVDNLVNNAITYGGSVPWIRLAVDASSPPAIRVEDRGLGISPALHERIFERFFRINHRLPGTGFGLHVGRVLAQACAGTLTLEWSELGAGSTFRLELPSAQTPE